MALGLLEPDRLHLSNEFLKELRGKKRVGHLWKEGQVTQEMLKDDTRSNI